MIAKAWKQEHDTTGQAVHSREAGGDKLGAQNHIGTVLTLETAASCEKPWKALSIPP